MAARDETTEQIASLGARLGTIPPEERIKHLVQLIQIVHAGGKACGINLLDNYNHRTFQIIQRARDIIPDLKQCTARTGSDAASSSTTDIEIKTSNIGASEGTFNPITKFAFMWDKQNDEIRIRRTLEPKIFIFGAFVDEVCHICLIVRDAAREHLITILSRMQQVFREKWNLKHENGKRGYDSISLTFKDIITIERHATLHYDLFVDGEWHRGIDGIAAYNLLDRVPQRAVRCGICKNTGHTKRNCPQASAAGASTTDDPA